MFVTWSAGRFAAVGTVYFMLGNAADLVVSDNSWSGDVGDLASEVAVYIVAVCLEHFAEIVFDGCHPSPPLYFYKWGNSVSIHISVPLVLWWHWGLLALGSVALFLWGVDVITGGVGQSFLNLNNFLTSFLL